MIQYSIYNNCLVSKLKYFKSLWHLVRLRKNFGNIQLNLLEGMHQVKSLKNTELRYITLI